MSKATRTDGLPSAIESSYAAALLRVMNARWRGGIYGGSVPQAVVEQRRVRAKRGRAANRARRRR